MISELKIDTGYLVFTKISFIHLYEVMLQSLQVMIQSLQEIGVYFNAWLYTCMY